MPTKSYCSLLPGNQILISKYPATTRVVVLLGWNNGFIIIVTDYTMVIVPDTGGTTMHRVSPVSGTITTIHTTKPHYTGATVCSLSGM